MDQNLIAVIVGFVEGVTEFLPVSSTGHMIIVGHMLGFDGPAADIFDVFVQLGAILSVIFIYKERFARFFTKEGWQADKGLSVWHVAAGIVPVMGVAFFAYKYIKEYLFSPFTVAIGLVLGALLMMYAEYKTKDNQAELLDDLDKISLKQAALVGAFQLLSLWPGFSRSGSVWVSSEFAGISKLSVLNEGASRVYPEKDSMADRSNTVRMIASTSDGDIWVGTRSGGLYIYDAKLEIQKKKFHHDINTYAVCEDNEGNLWIATRGEGVWIGDVKYRYDKLNDKSLSSDNVFCMLKDRKGRMWIGTFGGGLNLAVPTQDGKYEFRHFFTRTNGQRETRTLCEDSNGWIWVGSSEGIFVFDPDKLIADPEAYKHYSLESGDLQSNDIRAIIRDRKGHMWLAESGAGFGMSVVGHNYDKLEFTHYTSQDGLVSSMVQALIEDDKGMIWVSTEYGLSCFNPETVTFENYLFSDYILGNVYSENSVLKLQDGRLALGTGQGIVIVDPKHVSVKDTPMQVTFTDLKLNGISVIPGDKDFPLEASLAYAESVRLNYEQNSFVIEFSTFNYSDAGLSNFAYKLEGYDDTWSAPSSLNFAALSTSLGSTS